VLPLLNASNHATVLAFAKLPENIRGFGHVKAQHLAKVWPQWVALQKELPPRARMTCITSLSQFSE
jgi:indolepyruvate ferredoxin oxidoreductase